MKMFELVCAEQEHTGDVGLTVDVDGWKKGWGHLKTNYEDGLSVTAPRMPRLRRGLNP